MDKEKVYYTAKEVADILGISKGHSYKLIQKMNQELSRQGYLIVAGKISIRYFKERFYGISA